MPVAPLCGGQLLGIIAAGKQVTIDVHRQDDQGVAHSLLDHFRRQSEAAVSLPIDAPRRIEVAKRVHPFVLCLQERLTLFVQSSLD